MNIEKHDTTPHGAKPPQEAPQQVIPGHRPHQPPQDGHSPAPGKSKASLWIGGILFFAALAALGALPRVTRNRKLDADSVATKTADLTVNVITPSQVHGGGDLTLPSSIQAIEEATINARTSGYLKERLVDIGSRVKAGQTLAVIESPEADQQVLAAEADTAKSRAASGQAVADVAKQKAAVAAAQSELARAQSNVEQVRADLEHQNARLEESQSAENVAKARLSQAKQALQGRKADLAHGQAQFDLARKTLARWKELEKVDAVSGQEVDEKQTAYDVSQANVSAANAAVSGAQADVEAAAAAVTSSEADIRAMAADVKATRQKVEAAQSAVASARSNAAAAQASVAASQSNVQAAQAAVGSSSANTRRYAALQSYERITAPFDGVITARNVDVGALITAGSAGEFDPTRTVPHSGLFGIARTDTLRVEVSIPQSYIALLKPGEKARILVHEYPGRVFTGIVYRQSGALDAASRTLLTEIHIPNPGNTLIPGMFAQVQFSDAHAPSVLRIPANALITDAAGTRVAVVSGAGKIHFVKVQTGRDYGKDVEIVSGLKGDERLVSNPNDDLVEGGSVRVVETPKS